MSQPDGVLFDLDDTLFDDHGCTLAGLTAVAEHYVGADESAAWDPEVALGEATALYNELWPQVLAGELSVRDMQALRFRRLLAGWGVEADGAAAAKRFRAGYTASWALLPGAKATVKALRDRGIRTGVLSNAARSSQQEKVSAVGLMKHLDVFMCADDVPAPKPSREAFLAACEAMGTKPKNTVMVGDTLRTDVCGALDAGMRAVWLAKARPDLSVAREVETIAHLDELVPLLNLD